MESFIGFMNTPILKAKKGSRIMLYNDKEYEEGKSIARDGRLNIIRV